MNVYEYVLHVMFVYIIRDSVRMNRGKVPQVGVPTDSSAATLQLLLSSTVRLHTDWEPPEFGFNKFLSSAVRC